MAIHDVNETILTLTGSGQADTKPAIAKRTGLAPSTASAAVSCLVGVGVIVEAEHSAFTGGRCIRRLITSSNAGALTLVELGAHHGLIALTNPTRGVGQTLSLLIDIAEGPRAVLDAVMGEVSRQEEVAGMRVGGTVLVVPGPVDAERSYVIRPVRMSGWNDINVVEAVIEQRGLSVLIEDDARAGVIDESVYRRQFQSVAPIDVLICTKTGSAVGDTCLADGMPQVRQSGLTGDASHIPVETAAGRPYKRDNVGRLGTIASADSTRADLAAADLVYENNAWLLATVRDGILEVATAIRQAGTLLGHCVAHLVSFLAPQGAIVGGAFSAIDALTVGMRVALHQSCLPLVMEHLVIELSRSGHEAAPWGLSTLTPSEISEENHS